MPPVALQIPGHKGAVDPCQTHVMYASTCHLHSVNSTPIWNYLAGTQHMPFLCPHITGLTSYACVQKSPRITRFSFSYMLHVEQSDTFLCSYPSLCFFELFFSFKVAFTVSFRAVFGCSECVDKWMKNEGHK